MQHVSKHQPTDRCSASDSGDKLSSTTGTSRAAGSAGYTTVTTSLRRVGKSIQERTEQYFLSLAGKHLDIPTKSPRGLLYHVPDLPAHRNRDSVIRELDRTVTGMNGTRPQQTPDRAILTAGEYKGKGAGSHFKHHYSRLQPAVRPSTSANERTTSPWNPVTKPSKVQRPPMDKECLVTQQEREAGPRVPLRSQSLVHSSLNLARSSKSPRHGYTEDGEPRILQAGPSDRKPQLRLVTHPDLFINERSWKSYSPTNSAKSPYRAFKADKIDRCDEKEVVTLDHPELQHKKYRITTLCLSAGDSLFDELQTAMSAISPIFEDFKQPKTPADLISPHLHNASSAVELPCINPGKAPIGELPVEMQASTQILRTARARAVEIHSLARPLPPGQKAVACHGNSTNPELATKTSTRLHRDFEWPRFSDANYEDPAVEWSRQYRERKRVLARAEKQKQLTEPLIDFSEDSDDR